MSEKYASTFVEWQVLLFWHFRFRFQFFRFRFQLFSIFSFYFYLSFHHSFVLVLVFVNKFVIFSFFTIFVFVFVNENHTADQSACTLETVSLVNEIIHANENLAADVKRVRAVVEIYAWDAVETSCRGDVGALTTDGKTDEVLAHRELDMMLLVRQTGLYSRVLHHQMYTHMDHEILSTKTSPA